jgi:hypothetical protein
MSPDYVARRSSAKNCAFSSRVGTTLSICDDLIIAATTKELIEAGYLSRFVAGSFTPSGTPGRHQPRSSKSQLAFQALRKGRRPQAVLWRLHNSREKAVNVLPPTPSVWYSDTPNIASQVRHQPARLVLFRPLGQFQNFNRGANEVLRRAR